MNGEDVEWSNALLASWLARRWAIRWDFQQKECRGGVFTLAGVEFGGIGFSLDEAW
jgi:hypothetical protein